MLLASAMMLRWLGEVKGSRNALEAAVAIERAVEEVLAEGKIRTIDLGGSSKAKDFADAVIGRIG
jgi:3-isopropylmalate dehydrogenase